MRKFKINSDNSKLEPTPEQVKKYKDFSQVSHNYSRLTKRSKLPLYRDPKMFLLLLVIGIIAFLVISEYVNEGQVESQEIEQVTDTPQR